MRPRTNHSIDTRDERGTWVFLIPISNLKLTEATNFEFRIDRVTFVATDKLPRRRKRFGLPHRISELRHRDKGRRESLFDSPCFATLRQKGRLKDFEREIFDLIREELAILALSQLGYARRRNVYSPSISNENPMSSRSYYVTNAEKGSSIESHSVVGNQGSLLLSANWQNFQQKLFFFDLLSILRGKMKVSKGWRNDLRNAAILVGQSQVSRDLPQAFLWNMIALETLLTQQGDTYVDALPTRAEAFIGWTGYWKVEGFQERIRDVYQKRCRLVHAGNRNLITRSDVFFTDNLLLNLFQNIVGHCGIFASKSSVIEFSKKVEAEHLLGINARVRPKTLRYLHRTYSEDDDRW
jgi:hypothetical protein